MLTYALGRGLEYYDRPAIEKAVAELDKDGAKFSALVMEVVQERALPDAARRRRPPQIPESSADRAQVAARRACSLDDRPGSATFLLPVHNRVFHPVILTHAHPR